MTTNRRPHRYVAHRAGKTVRVYRLLGTHLWFAEAWEPSSYAGPAHSTITHTEDGALLGRLGSRALPPEVEAMRGGSPERVAACAAWRAAQAAEVRELLAALGMRGSFDEGMVELALDEDEVDLLDAAGVIQAVWS